MCARILAHTTSWCVLVSNARERMRARITGDTFKGGVLRPRSPEFVVPLGALSGLAIT